jgi:hypothetical protein
VGGCEGGCVGGWVTRAKGLGSASRSVEVVFECVNRDRVSGRPLILSTCVPGTCVCMCILTHRQPWTGNYGTSNYVKYQPIIPGLDINRTNPAAPNSCLVIASGPTYGSCMVAFPHSQLVSCRLPKARGQENES